MAFSSSDSPEEGLGAGDGVSGKPATAGSTGGLLRATKVGGADGKGLLSEGKQGHSVSAELNMDAGRWLVVRDDWLELGQGWESSVNRTKFSS